MRIWNRFCEIDSEIAAASLPLQNGDGGGGDEDGGGEWTSVGPSRSKSNRKKSRNRSVSGQQQPRQQQQQRPQQRNSFQNRPPPHPQGTTRLVPGMPILNIPCSLLSQLFLGLFLRRLGLRD